MNPREAGVESSLEERLKGHPSLEERLKGHPKLRARMEQLLAVVENASGDIEKANEAEQRVFEELRQMGQEALTGWAERQHEKKEKALEAEGGVSRKEKKPLLVQPVWENPNCRAGLPERLAGRRNPTLCASGGGEVPGVLGAVGTGAGGFWGG